MKKNGEKYFNFPVQLLNGLLYNTKKVLNDITDYAIYENSLKLFHGTELERMKKSAEFYNIELINLDNSFDNGRDLFTTISLNSPKVGLRLPLFWDFYNNDKTQFDKICLLGFLGIRSILGKKAYCKIDNKFWLSRMDGQVKAVASLYELSNDIQMYCNEYQTKKIKTELVNNWGLVTYSRYTRGFYISYSLNLEQLMFEAEKRRKSYTTNQRKQQQDELLKKVLKKLNNTQT